ncbi:MAG: TRAP transporter large permease subunit [Burkholderiales bacterium]
MLAHLDGALAPFVESLAAAIVVIEICTLFAGMVARYIFQTPLVWADEFASILFLWLASLGSVIALQRGAHMRMTAVVGMTSPRTREFFDVFASVATLTFVLAMWYPAFEYALDELQITTPALEISNIWRAAALPVGAALMALAALARIARCRLFASLTSITAVLTITTLLWATSSYLKAMGNANLLVFFVGIVAAAVFSGVPIAFAFGLATFGYLAITTDVSLTVIVSRMDEGMSHLILLAVPLFVFLGQLMEVSGMARAMVAFLASLLGHVRGGLSYVLIGAMYLVSGISGSKSADMAAIAPALFPEMLKRGAKPGELVALLAATGAQTETIPPSLVLIMIGSVTGVSIAALFTGGLLPAVVLGLTLCALVSYRYRNEDLSHVRRATKQEIARTFVIALPAVALPFLIRAAVVEGVATATEVSTIGIVYSFLVGIFIYRKMDWSRMKPMLIDTASLSGAILIIIGTANGMAWSLTQSGFSTDLARFMAGVPGGAATFLVVSIVVFVILGSVLEGIPAIVLFGPLLFPIARQMGIHEVHYAMVVILSMGIGLFAPPFGVGYYAACAISHIDPDEGMKPIVGYLAALMIGIALVAALPWISIGFL